jgi:2-polyprenyl-6-methoxyphenol hydroxylase-like FAD-dependent oxidoreductase
MIPRNTLMSILDEAVAQEPAIKLMTNSKATALKLEQPAAEGSTSPWPKLAVEVTTRSRLSNSTEQRTLRPQLVVGCDGIHSMVRQTLAAWQQEQGQPDAFSITQLPAVSAGLRYRMMQLPANPTTKQGTVLANSTTLVLSGVTRSKRDIMLKMFMVGIKDPSAPRYGSIITFPDHEIWQISDVDEMYDFLGRTFPQMDWRALVAREQMETFVAHPGGTFPQPQACSNLGWAVPQEEPAAGGAGGASSAAAPPPGGVLLLGDAIHCFPPDLAQGVNAALQDVVVLSEAMAQCGDDVAAAARAYEERRLADAQALPRLLQVCAGWLRAAGCVVLCNAAQPNTTDCVLDAVRSITCDDCLFSAARVQMPGSSPAAAHRHLLQVRAGCPHTVTCILAPSEQQAPAGPSPRPALQPAAPHLPPAAAPPCRSGSPGSTATTGPSRARCGRGASWRWLSSAACCPACSARLCT